MLQAIGLTSTSRRPGRPPAVDDLTFEARPGSVTALLGARGSGKTTALRMMLELEPGRGITCFRGRPLHRIAHPPREVGVLLGDVPGHPSRTARGQLRMLAAAAGVPASRADELLDVVGLAALRSHRLGALSLGMDRRLGIASALLGDPHTLLLDQPSAGLAPREAQWLHGLLRAHADHGGTVLYTTDDPREAARRADRVLALDGGRLVADQDGAAFARTRLRPRVAVHTPHAARLAALVAREARASGRSVEVVAESGGRLSVYGSDCARIGETAFRHGVLLHRLADETGEESAPVRTPGPPRSPGTAPGPRRSPLSAPAPAPGETSRLPRSPLSAPAPGGASGPPRSLGPAPEGVSGGSTPPVPAPDGASGSSTPPVPVLNPTAAQDGASRFLRTPAAAQGGASELGRTPAACPGEAPDGGIAPSSSPVAGPAPEATAAPAKMPCPAVRPALGPTPAPSVLPTPTRAPAAAAGSAPASAFESAPAPVAGSAAAPAPGSAASATAPASDSAPATAAGSPAAQAAKSALAPAPGVPPTSVARPAVAALVRQAAVPPLVRRPPRGPSRPVRYEVRRLLGVPSTPLTAAAGLAASVLIAVLLARSGGVPLPTALAAWPRLLPLPPAALAAGLLGALSFGDEYRHPALSSGRGTVPRRLGLLLAKLLVTAATAALLALVSALAAFAALRLLYGGEAIPVPRHWAALVAIWTALCVGCGWAGLLGAGVFRVTAAGVAAVLAVPVVVAPLVQRASAGPSVRPIAGLPHRLRELLWPRWPFDTDGVLGAATRMAAQPMGAALVLSLSVLICAYLITGCRRRARW
ncbi:ATP-binding cassette domain-containing protein [Streptomyces lichenis]|uniref:ATP-binding cassette domain-containing protein n=1 Tax=Streptomyces lichenis TaxID=2306967 RepID=A0ABT0I3K4_9ACTN|nr:ATP-binding cassette domain-containing protein [Streptomyces lichenis]MCK8675899.1 ATP-binding cassette domain-containing protein [Streptomyces lichenis]